MTFLNKIMRKPQSFFMWLFTSIIVTNTLLLLLTPGPESQEEEGVDKKNSTNPAGEEEEEEEEEQTMRKNKEIGDYSRKELFDALSEKSIYPDLETPKDELIKLLRSTDNIS